MERAYCALFRAGGLHSHPRLEVMDFNVMSSGDETGESLGIDVDRTENLSMIISTLIVASIVAFTGTIGFIGLVAPHIARWS